MDVSDTWTMSYYEDDPGEDDAANPALHVPVGQVLTLRATGNPDLWPTVYRHPGGSDTRMRALVLIVRSLDEFIIKDNHGEVVWDETAPDGPWPDDLLTERDALRGVLCSSTLLGWLSAEHYDATVGRVWGDRSYVGQFSAEIERTVGYVMRVVAGPQRNEQLVIKIVDAQLEPWPTDSPLADFVSPSPDAGQMRR